jgi:RNA polymerase sigma factor (sigma-70 family)
MSDSSVHTTLLQMWVQRIQAGDREARDELLRQVAGRLEELTRKMLRRFPRVHRWVDTEDVLQNASMRLLRSLEEVQPASMRCFFGLAAEQIRRELLDLTRHFYGPEGLGANVVGLPPSDDDSLPLPEPAAPVEGREDLEQWCHFHEEVEKLPAEEREVVGLIFYHGWTRADVAELFQVSERTVRRRWESALAKLRHILKD